jgi:DNA-binding beta-propeller fold protein YncE
MHIRKNVLCAFALCAALASGSALAAWERLAVEIGGGPLPEIAFSPATSRIYIPLVQDRALSVVDGARTQRLELPMRPTAVGYAASSGRIFVAGMFDNAVVAIDEATGVQTRLSVGVAPDNILVDDARGKVYVSNWGGIQGRGSLSVIDSATLAVRNVALNTAITAMAYDRTTGSVFLTGESQVIAVSPDGELLASAAGGFRTYSLAVDPRDGRVYVGALSGNPLGGVSVNRVVTVYAQPRLEVISRVEFPAVQHYNPLVFLVDPRQPGLYAASLEGSTLRRIDPNGNVHSWQLPLGSSVLEDGRQITHGIFGLNADPGSDRIFVSSPAAGMIAEFDPATGVMQEVEDGLLLVYFMPGGRMLVTDSRDGKAYLLRRAELLQQNPLTRDNKARRDGERGIKR